MTAPLRVLYVEPFDAGSHAAFGRTLVEFGADTRWTVLTMPGRHWKWRMRGSALWLAESQRDVLRAPHDLLLCSSFTPLTDLVALVPALAAVPRVVYFHENQWSYPVRADLPRDHHFGFTQLAAACAADLCLFNSAHNRDTFLAGSRDVLRRMPDARPLRTLDALATRCEVQPLPIALPAVAAADLADLPPCRARAAGPHLLWNHRWEHDKAPEVFFAALRELAARAVPFRVLVCGESYAQQPAVFAAARRELGERVVHWGTAASASDYAALLRRAQLAVSTARHEFFGVATLEAVHCGARPLVPDRLAYPEHFAAEYRYDDDDALVPRLETLCRDWVAGRSDLRVDRRALTAGYDAASVVPALVDRLRALAASAPR